MSLNLRVLLGALVLLIAALFAAKMRYRGEAPMKLPATDCNAALWDHVYERERLKVIEACTAVEGRIVSIHQSKDGDLHIGLDPDAKSVLNLVNVMHAHRTLVVEAVCDHPSNLAKVEQACSGFHSEIIVPAMGARVRVTGAYVTDRDNGWNEIHPVSRLELLK
jgi:hypothetical protein